MTFGNRGRKVLTQLGRASFESGWQGARGRFNSGGRGKVLTQLGRASFDSVLGLENVLTSEAGERIRTEARSRRPDFTSLVLGI